MKIFVGANILVSVLNHEYPLFSYSSRIVSLTDHSEHEIYTSPICLAIAFYFSEKKSGKKMAKKKMEILYRKIQSTKVDQEIVHHALQNPKIHDFEDGLEYYSAMQSGCEIILTEDKGDFYFSEIPVMNCQDFIRQFFGSRKK